MPCDQYDEWYIFEDAGSRIREFDRFVNYGGFNLADPWTGEGWDTIVDLWTLREGRSDLILQTLVRESAEGFNYDIRMVYVP